MEKEIKSKPAVSLDSLTDPEDMVQRALEAKAITAKQAFILIKALNSLPKIVVEKESPYNPYPYLTPSSTPFGPVITYSTSSNSFTKDIK